MSHYVCIWFKICKSFDRYSEIVVIWDHNGQIFLSDNIREIRECIVGMWSRLTNYQRGCYTTNNTFVYHSHKMHLMLLLTRLELKRLRCRDCIYSFYWNGSDSHFLFEHLSISGGVITFRRTFSIGRENAVESGHVSNDTIFSVYWPCI